MTTPLVAIEDAMEFLKITGPMQAGDEDRLTASIAAVSAYVEHAYRQVAERIYEDLRLPTPRGCALYPPRAPINVGQPITLTVNGVAQTVWRTEADGDPGDADVVVRATVADSPFMPDHFWRRAGWPEGATHPDPILLSYTGGFASNALPEDLKRGVLESVLTLYRDVQQGTVDLAATGAPQGGTTWELPRWLSFRARQFFSTHELKRV